MRRTVLCLLAFGLTLPLTAQEWAKSRLEKSPRHRETVTINHDGRALSAFVAYPEASKPRPVVLVIHEIFGLSDWAQELTDEIAAAGYVAIAPDLLSGAGPNGGGTAAFACPQGQAASPACGQSAIGRAINALPPDQITADLNAAADWALKQPASNGKLFVVGFCWGGGQSFRFATNRKDLRAAFVFYGVTPPDDALLRITAPVYGFYAGNDARISATVPTTISQMKAINKKYASVIYPGAGHGFMRAGEQEDPGPTPANTDARAAAWKVMLKVLSQRG